MLDKVYDPLTLGNHSAKLRSGEVEKVDGEDEVVSFASKGGEYRASGRAANKALPRFFVFFNKLGYGQGKKAAKQFQYVEMDSDGDDVDGCGFGLTDVGQEFSIKVAGSKLWKVTVRGRNLWEIYDYLTLHRMPWIRVADRDFADADDPAGQKPIILSVSVDEFGTA
jgi:hypothetical protein